ncbi:hypothetical protein [Hydrogenispora ethanolica]|uniref:hypothetical protein n=1 Tax=Hydrogenispora ethanolica TaxID=1082276 RepID=UPI001047A4E1|nr:hypothetical protein [Hydrogenispora ethanolica]
MILHIIEIGIWILAFVFRKQLSKSMVSFQNNVWGFKFTDRTAAINEIIIMIVSILGFITGLISLLGIRGK